MKPPTSTPTPITDAEEERQAAQYNDYREPGDPSFPADFDFARKLELQLAHVTESLARANDALRQLREAGSDLHCELVAARHKLRLAGFTSDQDLPGNAAIKQWSKLT